MPLMEQFFSGGVLSNGEPLYKGLGKTRYDIYLLENTDGLRIQIIYNGTGSLTTGNLKIIETNQLWTMLLAVILFGAIAAYGIVVYWIYDKRFSVSADKKHIFFFVMAIGFIASIPYFCGYNIAGADLVYHLQRIEGLKDGLLGGQFPVRIEPEWLYGQGYADAVFYCGAFLYIPALLRFLGFTVTTSYNIYCILLNFATAWIAFYCFYRILGKWWNGVICSALYTLSVFRIYKLLVTSAVGEGSALTFLPLVFYGLYRIFVVDPREAKYKTSWVPLMLGMAGLIQTHVLTCEITALVVLLFCIVNVRKVFQKNTILELMKGAVSAAAVSMWFLVPFIDYYLTQDVHIKHVSARTIQDRGLYLAHLAFHFWSVGENTPMGDNGMQHSHPVGIGAMLIVGLVFFLILWFSGKLQGRRASFAKKTAFISIILLIMSLSMFPWDRIQNMNRIFAALVSSIQFPNRFLGWGTICLVFLFGYCLCCLTEWGNKKGLWILTAAALIGITTSDMFLLDYTNAGRDVYKLYDEENMGVGYISGAEYLLEGTKEEDITFTGPKAGENVEIAEYEKKYLHVNLQCHNSGTEESYIEVPILLYKGYVATGSSDNRRMELCAGDNNVVRVLIPPGFEGGVEIKFLPPIYWRIAELISGMTIILLIALRCSQRRGRHVS